MVWGPSPVVAATRVWGDGADGRTGIVSEQPAAARHQFNSGSLHAVDRHGVGEALQDEWAEWLEYEGGTGPASDRR